MELEAGKTEWDLSPLLSGDDDPSIEEKRKEIEEKNKTFVDKWKDRDDYLKDPEILKEALDEFEALEKEFGTSGVEGYYFSMRNSQDSQDPKVKAGVNKVDDFETKLENELQFFMLRIAKIPEAEQGKFLEHPGLKDYKHFLESGFAGAKYLLSEPEEKIMNLKSSVSHSNWIKMVSDFFAKEEREVLLEDGNKGTKNFSEILSLSYSKNKEVRDDSAEKFNEILRKHVEVAEVEMNSILANKKINDEIRGLERPDSARHIEDDIDSEVVDTLLDAVSGRFDIAKRHYKLKAKLMKVPKLKYHERNVEYGHIDKKYPYNESVDLVYKVLKNLDEKFGSIFKEYVEKGLIDVFPRKGKRGGAFCAHNLITQPTYIMLNHTDNLTNVETLAHEVGHGINNELMKENQNSLNFDTPKATAEVASTFMEDFVIEELMRESDDEMKLVLRMAKLNGDISKVFRQVAFYKFEQELHKEFREKGYLPKEEIGELFRKHMEAYMGDYVEQSEGSENWWAYVPHFRMFFYVYSYSSGLLISKSLQGEVKKDPEFIEKVKDFLGAGTSDSPKNIFKKMGIDIADKAFWNKGIDEVELLLKDTEELAKKLGRI